MLNYLDFRHYSLAVKIGIWGGILLFFIFILAMQNIKQFRKLGDEVEILSAKELPTITAIHNLDLQIYQQTILRNHIATIGIETSTDSLQTEIERYNRLSIQIAHSHQSINDLMKDYTKLQMQSDKVRWKRLQVEHQKALQTRLDNLIVKINQHKELAQQSFNSISNGNLADAKNLESQLIAQDQIFHQEIEQLSVVAFAGISNSTKKIHHIEYGARQITLFILFWFYFIGIIVGGIIIKMISSSLKNVITYADEISAGHYKSIAVTQRDELGHLTCTLNDIAKSLEEREKT